jgi:hypothetical protein
MTAGDIRVVLPFQFLKICIYVGITYIVLELIKDYNSAYIFIMSKALYAMNRLIG